MYNEPEPLPPLTNAEVANYADLLKQWQSEKRAEGDTRYEFVISAEPSSDPHSCVVDVLDWQGVTEDNATSPWDQVVFSLSQSQINKTVVREFQKHGITLFNHLVAA
ncbi:hypothetical protein [Asticcacaulis sp.]|uniref:hypothetical protein n=1 Tax=Asticcacaulis sp. TaxID=1872648 RepID=UPI00391BAB54